MNRKQYTPEQRVTLLARVNEYRETMSVAAALKKAGISHANFYAWSKKAKGSGKTKVILHENKTILRKRRKVSPTSGERAASDRIAVIIGAPDVVLNTLKELNI